jgi:hypothetical protein
MDEQIKWPRRTAIDATLISAFAAAVFATLLRWARINELEPYVWTTVFCFLLWPLWYAIVIPKMKSESRSWKPTFWTGIVWLGLCILHGSRLNHQRSLADQYGVAIEVLLYLAFSVYCFQSAQVTHREQSGIEN